MRSIVTFAAQHCPSFFARRSAWLLVAATLAGCAGAQPRPAARPAPHHPLPLTACTGSELPAGALCGKLAVWEDRTAHEGRKIELNVVVLPALGPDPAPDPVFILAGGPGAGSTESADGYADTASPLRRRRDLVFVDQRGTGGSHQLQCAVPGSERDLQGYFLPVFTQEIVTRCRAALEEDADLSLYTSSIAADDLEEVRQWLGYGQINLEGGSYGTRAAQVYMRRHPTSVRSAVLFGTAAFPQHLPLYHARDEHRALDLLLGDCLADESCRAAFPDVRAELAAVMARLDAGPVTATIPGAEPGETVTVELAKGAVAEELRFTLYGAQTAVYTPLLIHQAAAGDFAPLARVALRWEKVLRRLLAYGMHLSVTCAEDVPFIPRDQVAALTAGTELGDYRVRQQLQACSLWPRGEIPADFHQPLVSDIPTLLMTGRLDPVTPPSWAESVVAGLSRGRHVVLPHGHHGFGGLGDHGCVDGIEARFLEQASAEGLDVSCAEQLRRGPWVTDPAKLEDLLGKQE